jgi:hypothetical protein
MKDYFEIMWSFGSVGVPAKLNQWTLARQLYSPTPMLMLSAHQASTKLDRHISSSSPATLGGSVLDEKKEA